VTEVTQGQGGGGEEREGAVLGTVGHKLVKLLQSPVFCSTVKVIGSETLLDTTANKSSRFLAVDTDQLLNSPDFFHQFCILRR